MKEAKLYDKLLNGLKKNCKHLINGEKLEDCEYWKGNPYPVHNYFLLFRPSGSNIDDEYIDDLFKNKDRLEKEHSGIEVIDQYDSGWGYRCIKVCLKEYHNRNKWLTKIIKNWWFRIMCMVYYTRKCRFVFSYTLVKFLILAIFSKRDNNRHFFDYLMEIKNLKSELSSVNPDFDVFVLGDTKELVCGEKIYYEAAGFKEFCKCGDINVPYEYTQTNGLNDFVEVKLPHFNTHVVVMYRVKNKIKWFVISTIVAFLIGKFTDVIIALVYNFINNGI